MTSLSSLPCATELQPETARHIDDEIRRLFEAVARASPGDPHPRSERSSRRWPSDRSRRRSWGGMIWWPSWRRRRY